MDAKGDDAADRLLAKAAAAAEQKRADAAAVREREQAAARQVEAAANASRLNPPPEVQRMRELGQAFVAVVGSRKKRLRDRRARYPNERVRPSPLAIAPDGRSQLGWQLNMKGNQSVVVLDDGRVGHAAYVRTYFDHSANQRSEHHQWQDLPWSEELENTLVEWLVERGITRREPQ
jgi:hypothetical protein